MRLFKYKKLLKIKVMHNYFTLKTCKGLIFQPTERSLAVMSKQNLRFRETKEGFEIFGETGDDDSMVKSISGMEKLVFFILSDNPQFTNFSDLDLNQKPRQIYYFNNLAANKTTVFGLPGNVLLMHTNDKVTNDHLVNVVPDSYRFDMTGTGPEKTAKIISIDNSSEVISKDFSSVNNNYPCQFILMDLDYGRYKLQFDGLDLDTFYYGQGLLGRKIFGIIEIFSTAAGEYKFFTSGNKPQPREYVIAIDNRKTLWRYLVQSRNGIALPDPEIKQASVPWNFNRISSSEFISAVPMPLQEAPIKEIQLKSDKNDNGSVVVKDLPNPGTELIKPDPVDPTKVYSDVYVYI